ncbi:hypothetical protein [Methanolacinia paynteri]|uniref:hypothetical protein n=1 Tax=Methanolacinia paynteri TaxID=230356 RepID=UPI00064E89F0|nr:hypothetical protein [Methanolacinia paynteri]
MDIQSYIVQGMDYLLDLPAKVQSGDLFAIMVALIIIYCIVVLLRKFTRLVAPGAKKIFIFLIIVIAAYIFFQSFLLRILTEGLTLDNIIFGFGGLICGILAVAIALHGAVKSYKKGKEEKLQQAAPATAPQGPAPYPPYPPASPGGYNGANGYPPQPQAAEGQQSVIPFLNLTKDNSVGMVIIYLIIAEFGIFSSKTIAAVSSEMGFYFFLIFMAAAFIFIKLTYHDYLKGLRHFAIVTMLGFILSIILGHFWGGVPLDTLLSMDYFGSDALVALITGIALSLFMSSKG